ncbi:MAG: polysaccharide deacetylase family protein [Candidatus Glassbacteria bacterium]|nr:polysaccharide deacetylase family protein [Candidatus Glassbacteria bacterium]
MRRKEFFTTAAAGLTAAAAADGAANESEGPVHIVSLSFDDGFRKSFTRTAEIYEKFGLSACFNIVASGSDPDTEFSDSYATKHPIGGWELWNELADRGHEIMPHGWRHAHLPDMPLTEAQGLVRRCLDRFSEKLRGFDAKKSVFNFPYNQSSPELEAWLPEVVLAFRTSGGGINALPGKDTVKITTEGYGPDNSEEHLDRRLAEFTAGPSGWFVYNLHGLDEEGWGPIRASYLEKLLARPLDQPTVRMVPVGRVLMQS